MNKFILALVFISPLFAFGQSVPSENDFLRACYAICEQFRLDPNYYDNLAEMNLKAEGREDYAKSVRLKKLLKQLGHYKPDLVRAVLVTSARAWMAGNGSHFPARRLSDVQTAAIQQYTSEEYKTINPALRSGQTLAHEFRVYRDFINDALLRLPKFSGMVHRGINTFEGWDKIYVEGQPTTEHAFMSTSSDFKDFKFASNICILVNSKSGRDISKISRSEKEKEVLYPAGTKFFVKKVDLNWNQPRGKILIELEEI